MYVGQSTEQKASVYLEFIYFCFKIIKRRQEKADK
jgi:hypothetical protein